MTHSLTSKVALVGLTAGLAATGWGCSSKDSGGGGNAYVSQGGSGTTAGTGSTTAGTGGNATGGSSTGMSGSSGVSGSATGGGSGGASGGMSMGGDGGMGGSVTAGAGGMSGAGGGTTADITKVLPGSGCGKDASSLQGTHTIHTMGTKPAGCADAKCGAWAYDREYTVYLPQGYDNTKAYPLVFEGPGCGGDSKAIYPLTIPYPNGPSNAANTVIRVGLRPPPNDIGHATNPGQGCFDDKEGDDSVDWVFYENLYDLLDGKDPNNSGAGVCFDHNRVFSTGNSSGAWFSNEVGCKYAGDPTRPIRGIAPNTGGLPTTIPSAMPTCTDKPMAGIWMGDKRDPENDFVNNKYAMNRAMMVNGCQGNDVDQAQTVDYPVDGLAPNTCVKVMGCPDLYPIIYCLKDDGTHAGHDDWANPAFSTFFQQFSKGAFISQ